MRKPHDIKSPIPIPVVGPSMRQIRKEKVQARKLKLLEEKRNNSPNFEFNKMHDLGKWDSPPRWAL
jgi:hypothetical protein